MTIGVSEQRQKRISNETRSLSWNLKSSLLRRGSRNRKNRDFYAPYISTKELFYNDVNISLQKRTFKIHVPRDYMAPLLSSDPKQERYNPMVQITKSISLKQIHKASSETLYQDKLPSTDKKVTYDMIVKYMVNLLEHTQDRKLYVLLLESASMHSVKYFQEQIPNLVDRVEFHIPNPKEYDLLVKTNHKYGYGAVLYQCYWNQLVSNTKHQFDLVWCDSDHTFSTELNGSSVKNDLNLLFANQCLQDCAWVAVTFSGRIFNSPKFSEVFEKLENFGHEFDFESEAGKTHDYKPNMHFQGRLFWKKDNERGKVLHQLFKSSRCFL